MRSIRGSFGMPRRPAVGSRLLLCAAAAALAIAVTAPSAHAGVLVASAPNCAAQALSQPFARFGDYARYALVPGGTFEKGAPGWSLSRAAAGSANERFYVHGAGESHPLTIPPGGAAT